MRIKHKLRQRNHYPASPSHQAMLDRTTILFASLCYSPPLVQDQSQVICIDRISRSQFNRMLKIHQCVIGLGTRNQRMADPKSEIHLR